MKKTLLSLGILSAVPALGAVAAPDPLTVWTAVDLPSLSHATVANPFVQYLEGQFIVFAEVGAVHRSRDGFTWERVALPGDFVSLDFLQYDPVHEAIGAIAGFDSGYVLIAARDGGSTWEILTDSGRRLHIEEGVWTVPLPGGGVMAALQSSSLEEWTVVPFQWEHPFPPPLLEDRQRDERWKAGSTRDAAVQIRRLWTNFPPFPVSILMEAIATVTGDDGSSHTIRVPLSYTYGYAGGDLYNHAPSAGVFGAGRFVLAGSRTEAIRFVNGVPVQQPYSSTGWVDVLSYESYMPHRLPHVGYHLGSQVGDLGLVDIAYAAGVFVAVNAQGQVFRSGTAAEEHPFWGEAWVFSDDWKQLPECGWIWDGYDNWSYHVNVGWVWHGATPDEGMYFEIAGLGWVYSTPKWFPWVKWGAGEDDWYLVDLSTFAPDLNLWYYTETDGWRATSF